MKRVMRVRKIRNLPKVGMLIVIALILFSSTAVLAAEGQRRGEDTLRDAYRRVEARINKNMTGTFYLESAERSGRVSVDLYGIVDSPFSSVLSHLTTPANWCNVAALHPFIKTCSYKPSGNLLMTLYTSREGHKSPGEVYQFNFRYRDLERRPGYLHLVLNADEGPFGTKDHNMRFEALPLDNGKTFVRLSYCYGCGFLTRIAGKLYSALSSEDKVGFTVSGTDGSGNPVYVAGQRGAIERNAVRYYFAILSFLDTVSYPEENRFGLMISRWYDLTDHFKKQLFQMDKKEYLAFKTEEHRNQLIHAHALTSLK